MIIDSISNHIAPSRKFTMHPALLVQDLRVSLRGRALIDGVTFTVDRGQRLALLGASGSGKSLTAAALLGQLPASMSASGRLQINGVDVTLSDRRTRRSGLTAIHQDPMSALNPLVRLGKQLEIPLRHAGLSGSAARKRAFELLASMGIEEAERTMESFSGELSGGQLQRVCIALALACRSSVLVADEPTTALDMVSQAKVLEALSLYSESACSESVYPESARSAAAGAMLFITHDLAVAAAFCHQALVLSSGRIVEEGSMESVVERPRHQYTKQLVEAAHLGFDSLRRRATA
ncbi:ATP-binding cassette domain-containing protein [Arthrobacter bambusae]|uniref:ATP-binding cassette domain-containing protein n=1 Tax=Arthrobacter bambusae TaxID=1338426 RepID=UPI00277FDBE2|nr:ABC transporter ATP-binding protein [Arthrobacter bambusae]MDQ0238936.1 ABC-type dipeptide/oligopeptide/nickel transport system ATPase component [Arthrobacter bambusae]